MLHRQISPRWTDLCIVAATGPSLDEAVAERCRGHRVIAVNDAYRLMPWAEVLYACDTRWWDVHKGAPGFMGEKWSSHGSVTSNNKTPASKRHGLNLVRGKDGDGFSLDPGFIHYGRNSGFQAINLAILFGATRIVLVGFDMRLVEKKRHFFGDHKGGLTNHGDPRRWLPEFQKAARRLPPEIRIINCTPGSALACFETAELDDALPIAA